MMNPADPLFLIILLYLLMSSRAEKSFNLCSSLSLSLCHSAGFFFSPKYSQFSPVVCLASHFCLSFMPLSFLHELFCHYFSECFTVIAAMLSLVAPLVLSHFSYRFISFLKETESRRYSKNALFLNFTVSISVSFSFLLLLLKFDLCLSQRD